MSSWPRGSPTFTSRPKDATRTAPSTAPRALSMPSPCRAASTSWRPGASGRRLHRATCCATEPTCTATTPRRSRQHTNGYRISRSRFRLARELAQRQLRQHLLQQQPLLPPLGEVVRYAPGEIADRVGVSPGSRKAHGVELLLCIPIQPLSHLLVPLGVTLRRQDHGQRRDEALKRAAE